jgi:heavy metal-(Cd/Co/Hg/Pb/Zn)-translocating P-type ATPase
MLCGIVMRHFGWFDFAGRFASVLQIAWFVVAVVPVARPVLADAWEAWHHGDIMNEFTLMLLACVGAFVIGEYPEGVAILLFYSFGEKLEHSASQKARSRITSLLENMPDTVTVVRPDGSTASLSPDRIKPGDHIRLLPGQRLAVDATLVSPDYAEFNTSAITGESVPVGISAGHEISSGAIPLDREVTVSALRPYADSTMTRIMNMIEDAASKKSRSETLLRKITRYYTPAVMIAAVLVMLVPWIVCSVHGVPFDSGTWFYRSLVLLVCSCPCALVVSIPLSYFAAIGNASRMGMLFKGSRYLDAMRSIDTLYLDKTGTLTTGSFSVSAVEPAQGYTADTLLAYVAALDAQSTHPLAVAICKAARNVPVAEDVRTIPHGIEGTVNDHRVLAGSPTLMREREIDTPAPARDSSLVCVAVDGRYAGTVYLDDTLKPDAASTVAQLHRLGVKKIIILSGDRPEAVAHAAEAVGADGYEAKLLPQTKHTIVENARAQGHNVAFVGDGINDAPSLAAANVGIAIGTGGTDVAMESADAVITGHKLGHLAYAIKLSHKIKRVVTFNVAFAIAVKIAVMVLGIVGVASLWAAVFADTGITLLTVVFTLVALRYQGRV